MHGPEVAGGRLLLSPLLLSAGAVPLQHCRWERHSGLHNTGLRAGFVLGMLCSVIWYQLLIALRLLLGGLPYLPPLPYSIEPGCLQGLRLPHLSLSK